MFAKLTFAAVRSVVNAGKGADSMKLATIVRATNQSRTATLPVVTFAITVCANFGDHVRGSPWDRLSEIQLALKQYHIGHLRH